MGNICPYDEYNFPKLFKHMSSVIAVYDMLCRSFWKDVRCSFFYESWLDQFYVYFINSESYGV